MNDLARLEQLPDYWQAEYRSLANALDEARAERDRYKAILEDVVQAFDRGARRGGLGAMFGPEWQRITSDLR